MFLRAFVAAHRALPSSLAACGSSAAAEPSARLRRRRPRRSPATGPAGRHAHGRRRAGARLLRLDRPVRRLAVGHVDGADPDAAAGVPRRSMKDGELVEVPGPVLAGEPTFETDAGRDDHLQHQARRRCGPTACRSRAPTSSTRPTSMQNGKDIYDPTGYTDIDKVDVPDAEDRRRHVQEGQDATPAGTRCSRAASASSRRTSSRARTATQVMKNGYTWSGGPWFAKWNKGDVDHADARTRSTGARSRTSTRSSSSSRPTPPPSSRRSSRARSTRSTRSRRSTSSTRSRPASPTRNTSVQRRRPASVEALWFNNCEAPVRLEGRASGGRLRDRPRRDRQEAVRRRSA